MSARPGDLPDWTVYCSKLGTSHTKRVHIKAPADAFPRSSVKGRTAFCGVLAFTFEEREVVDPARLPKGTAWCGKCIGGAAEYLCLLPQVAAMVQTALSNRCQSLMPTAAELLRATS